MTRYGTFALALAATTLATTAAVAQRSSGVSIVTKLYEVGSTMNTTTISGKGGSPVSHTLRSTTSGPTEGDAVPLLSMFFYEKSDDPVRVSLTGSLPVLQNGEESRVPASFALGSSDFNHGSQEVVSVGAERAITSIQVCLNNDKIKGVRVWGADFDAQGNPRRDDAIYAQFRRNNCREAGWQPRRSCPGNQIAVGARFENSPKGFSGISLICTDFKRVQRPAGTPWVPLPLCCFCPCVLSWCAPHARDPRRHVGGACVVEQALRRARSACDARRGARSQEFAKSGSKSQCRDASSQRRASCLSAPCKASAGDARPWLQLGLLPPWRTLTELSGSVATERRWAMDSLRRASLASAALLLGGAAACAEGLDAHFEEPTPEREPTAVPISFEVTVREASARGWPMRDARCVVEVDGLALAEQRSDVEGRVVFELPTWEAELALTCAKRHATSWVGLRRDELAREQFVIHVREDAPRLDAVRIMGAIHGPDEPGESFLVQSSRQVGRSYEGAEPSFVVETERGVPFALLALRYRFPEVSEPNHYALDVLGWTATRHRGTDGGALIDVDFDRELEPMVVQGSLGLSRSERPDRPLDGPTTWGLLQVYPKDRYGTVLLGLATDTFYSERGRLHYTAQSFEGFYADDEVLTQFVVADKVAGGPYSVLLLEGYPPMGQLHHRFLEPPLVLEPKARVPLEGAVLRWAPDEVQANVFVVEDASGGSLWVNWADERSELVVPTLPFRWRPLSEGTLRGRLLRVEEGALEGFYERVAASKELRFSP